MTACMHTRIESCDHQDDDMHCAGWRCADCQQAITGEYHHRSWCDRDFCGKEPERLEAYAVRG